MVHVRRETNAVKLVQYEAGLFFFFVISHQISYIKLFKVIYIYLSKGPIHHLIKYKNTDSES